VVEQIRQVLPGDAVDRVLGGWGSGLYFRICTLSLRTSKPPERVNENARGAAIVLVVLEDPLSDRAVARLDPLAKPLDRTGTGGIGVPPLEAEEHGQRLRGKAIAGVTS